MGRSVACPSQRATLLVPRVGVFRQTGAVFTGPVVGCCRYRLPHQCVIVRAPSPRRAFSAAAFADEPSPPVPVRPGPFSAPSDFRNQQQLPCSFG